MTDVRIVYTYDAAPFVETLTRLLGAEQYNVRLSCGRLSAREIDAARGCKEAVMLVWSYDAPAQDYMLEWAQATDTSRLVEVARAPGAPRLGRRAPVIDFASWRGERSARCWLALNDRLHAVERVLDPPKPAQMQATFALGLASVAAVAGAVFVRANDTYEAPVPLEQQALLEEPSVGMGGAMRAVEPASYNEGDVLVRAYSERMIEPRSGPTLHQLASVEPLDLRGPTLLEQLAHFIPTQRDNTSGGVLFAAAASTQPVEDSPSVYFVTHLE